MTAATAPPPRIVTLDVVRGVAVLGILAMNMVAFSMPQRASLNPAVYGGTEGLDLFAWIASFILVEGKTRGLFSLLFGASMLLVIDGAEAKAESAAAIHYRRMLWLALFGAAHLYLIWWGDILLHYALVGMIAFLFRNAGLRQLGLWIVLLLAYQQFLMGGVAATFLHAAAEASLPNADPRALAAWESLRGTIAPLPSAALAQDLALHRGDWWPLTQARVAANADIPRLSLMMSGAETLAYMLMGMAALRSGLLTAAWRPRSYLIVAASGIAVGGAGFAVLAALIVRSGFDPATMFAAGQGGTVLLRPPMIVGYAALIVLLARHDGWLKERLAAAGRAAFTNYLGTSMAMTLLFYGHGFGLYGSLGRAEVYGVVLVMWALMLAWSKPWLDRCRYGPFEWLWRSLARWQLQPMRKRTA